MAITLSYYSIMKSHSNVDSFPNRLNSTINTDFANEFLAVSGYGGF